MPPMVLQFFSALTHRFIDFLGSEGVSDEVHCGQGESSSDEDILR